MYKSTSAIAGVFILMLGGIYLLGELGYMQEFSLFRIFILCSFISFFIKAIFRRSRSGIIYNGSIVYYYIATLFDLPTISLWSIIVFATFLNVGLSLIFRPKDNNYDFTINF